MTSASLAVTCKNGHAETVEPIKVTLAVVVFKDVAACGAAHLVLSAQAQDASGAISSYVGEADSVLSPGEVAVQFVGSLSAGPLSNPNASTVISELVVTPVGFRVTSVPAFDAATQSYTMVVSRDAKAVKVIVNTASPSATVSIAGQPGNAQLVALDGQNGTDITLLVTDTGLAPASTTLHVTAAVLPDDAGLSGLTLVGSTSMLILSPKLSDDVFEYTAVGPAGNTGASIIAIAHDARASLTVNGAVNTADLLPLVIGTNDFTLRVLAQDGITYNDYVLHVPELKANVSDASLVLIAPDVGTLSPAFDPQVTEYTLLVSSRRRQVLFTVVPGQAAAQIEGTGNPAVLHSFTPATDSVGFHIISPDTSANTQYNVTVTRGLLDNLDFTNVGWDSFQATTLRYQLNNSQNQTLVTATATAPSVTLALTGGQIAGHREHDGEVLAPGASALVHYAVGLNHIIIEASLGDEYDMYFLDSLSKNVTPSFGVAEISPNQVGYQAINNTSLETPANEQHISATAGVHAMAVAPDGKTIFYANDAGVEGYTIGGAETGLAALADAGPLAIEPTGRYLYVGTSNRIVRVDLADNSTQSLLDPAPTALAVDPSGRFLHAGHGGATNEVTTYEIIASGALRRLGASSFSGAIATLIFAADIADGKTLYVSDGASLYSVDVDDGILTTQHSVGSAGLAHIAVTQVSQFIYAQSPTSFDIYGPTVATEVSGTVGAFQGVTVDPTTGVYMVAIGNQLFACSAGQDVSAITSCPKGTALTGVTDVKFFTTY